MAKRIDALIMKGEGSGIDFKEAEELINLLIDERNKNKMNLKNALEFYDKVNSSSSSEIEAAQNNHIEWLVSAVREVVT